MSAADISDWGSSGHYMMPIIPTKLNRVSSSFKSEKERRVIAVVAKARYPLVTKNQTQQRFEHAVRSHPSNKVLKLLLDSGSDGA